MHWPTLCPTMMFLSLGPWLPRPSDAPCLPTPVCPHSSSGTPLVGYDRPGPRGSSQRCIYRACRFFDSRDVCFGRSPLGCLLPRPRCGSVPCRRNVVLCLDHRCYVIYFRLFPQDVHGRHPVYPSSLNHPWTLQNNELVRRTLRYVKRLHGYSHKAAKLPVSYAVLRAIFPRLPHWPNVASMSHDDRLFVLASLLGVAGFLRGGEFLFSERSRRPTLLGAALQEEAIESVPTAVVYIARPKNQWWVSAVRVPCFAPSGDQSYDPCHWLRAYRRLSSVRLTNASPALQCSSGAPLSRDTMVRRTSTLASAAGIQVLAGDGTVAPVRASSWRAGAVRSATDAGVSDGIIMALGRWRSIAWERYLLHSVSSLQGAARAMWSAPGDELHGRLRVAESRAQIVEYGNLEEDVENDLRLRMRGHRQAMG